MGAWIETVNMSQFVVSSPVAPYVGAWIETLLPNHIPYQLVSHPTWVRGLKHSMGRLAHQVSGVAPYVGAWIETRAEET